MLSPGGVGNGRRWVYDRGVGRVCLRSVHLHKQDCFRGIGFDFEELRVAPHCAGVSVHLLLQRLEVYLVAVQSGVGHRI